MNSILIKYILLVLMYYIVFFLHVCPISDILMVHWNLNCMILEDFCTSWQIYIYFFNLAFSIMLSTY